MKILGISGSSRDEKTSGTYKLVETVLNATGCDYEIISLRGKKISGCIACLGCVETNVCILNDDMKDLRDKIVSADAYVIGSPNFYSGLNATTHAFLERLYQFRHREGDLLWGKLGVAIGVGGSTGLPVVNEIEKFFTYNFIDTVAKVVGQGAACCFSCGYGETCKVGVITLTYGNNVKITEDMIPDVKKQPLTIESAINAGKKLGSLLKNGYDKKEVVAKLQKVLMERFRETT